MEFPPSIETLGLATRPNPIRTNDSSTLLSAFQSIGFNNVKAVEILRQVDQNRIKRSRDQVYNRIFKLLEGQGIRFECDATVEA
ncbi:hypothetical protein BDN72DRAFT_851696 [Pluteus cervinus]|uniref:Uncharacterized protein n=1 Tax=Pluteus cervinus TaxID=181527 RepID=A0ACD2ZYB2_9AGAR|nr:hypothetical protein BDN72DRAFT_851696 [Pluteus cervinus]